MPKNSQLKRTINIVKNERDINFVNIKEIFIKKSYITNLIFIQPFEFFKEIIYP